MEISILIHVLSLFTDQRKMESGQHQRIYKDQLVQLVLMEKMAVMARMVLTEKMVLMESL